MRVHHSREFAGLLQAALVGRGKFVELGGTPQKSAGVAPALRLAVLERGPL